MLRILPLCFFFFQAEDGIRDFHVTGVQTCALPISRDKAVAVLAQPPEASGLSAPVTPWRSRSDDTLLRSAGRLHRSEERRVGKECRSRWWPERLNKERHETRELWEAGCTCSAHAAA